ncbi:MAG TPA: hypothetical protein PLS41_10160, partial [Bacteroidales bacterium]|nr:hypothetical protein [Bacteroidales bacterium]
QEVQNDYQEFPVEALNNYMMNALSKKGKSLGTVNSDGTIYIIGAATTARPSNMPGFINSRNIAYNIAELEAKMNLLRMSGEELKSGRGYSMLENLVEGEDPDARKKASMLQKAAKIVDTSLDKALSYLGVSDEEIAKMNQSKKEAMFEQKFNQTITSLVAGMVKGCAVVRIAEGDAGKDDYQVAVCMKYSPEFQSLASVIRENSQYQLPLSKVSNSKEKILAMSPEALIGRMGVSVTFNEKGQMVVYGFGQREVQSTSSRQSAAFSRAYSQARLQAVNNIKNFVAEDLVAMETQEEVEKLSNYDDDTENYFSKSVWQQSVEAKVTTLDIATEQVRQWRGKHPVSGHDVAGFVVAWTPSNAETAKQLREQFNDDQKSDAEQNKGNVEAAPQRQQTTKSKIIISGEEEEDL